MTMKPLAALWRVAIALTLAIVLLIMIANVITNPVAKESTRGYTAAFTDASGLHTDGDVRVRGVRVGKVASVELARRSGQNVAVVTFTLEKQYAVVAASRLAIKFQALTGVRYLDVLEPAENYAEADVVADAPIAMTQPSFDITALFNGLQPVLATLSPKEIDTFTANAASFLSGDGTGLSPLLDSLRRLTEFVSDRQQIIATLIRNLAELSKAIGGSSTKLIHILDLVEELVDNGLSVLDEYRKGTLYGRAFWTPVVRLLHNAGFGVDTNVDQALDRAFSNLDNFFDTIKLVPVINENIPLPDQDGTPEQCARGRFQLPETMDVLLNGQRVVLCNR